jgi:hypothetical protein
MERQARPPRSPTRRRRPHPKPAKAADGERLHAFAVDEPAAEVVAGHGQTGSPPPVEPAEHTAQLLDRHYRRLEAGDPPSVGDE